MCPDRKLAELAQRREQLRVRIRVHRSAIAAAGTRVLTPLRWIDLGLRVHRLTRQEADWWIAATLC